MAEETQSIDFETVTNRQKKTWATGDFNEIARLNVGMSEALCDVVDPHAGQRVLDVACGSGTAALVAERRFCDVTGIDYVPALIDRAKSRAQANGQRIDFRVGDAQDLPFPDNTFDVILSVYGVQFAPDHTKAAAEISRVCKPGGKIGLASPIPAGWSGDWFAAHAKYAPPPPGLPSPLRWGTSEGLVQLLGESTRSIENEERTARQYYHSLDHAVDIFKTHFGPTIRILEQNDSQTETRFLEELKDIFRRYNIATDGTAIVENRYFQTVAIIN